MKLHILDSTKKKKFIGRVAYLGVKKAPYMLLQSGAEKLRAYSGNLSNVELSALAYLLPVETIGLYFARDTAEGTRLTVDAMHALKEQITGNVVMLTGEQEKKWFSGDNVQLNGEQQDEYKEFVGFVTIKSADGDLLGMGKISPSSTVLNYLPKERRVRHAVMN